MAGEAAVVAVEAERDLRVRCLSAEPECVGAELSAADRGALRPVRAFYWREEHRFCNKIEIDSSCESVAGRHARAARLAGLKPKRQMLEHFEFEFPTRVPWMQQ